MAAMTTDAYDLTLTTSSPTARDAYDTGVRGLLAWKADALAHFDAATAADPGLAVAHAGAAVCHFLDERFEVAREAGEQARAAAAGQSARERGHAEAIALLVSGKVTDSERVMREHLEAFPRDLPILQRLYVVWFWQGRFPEMLGLTTAFARHYPGTSYMLGMHAFALEQADRCDEAIRVAQAAITANPDDAWSVHALAHALYEMESYDTGVRRLPPATHACTGLNWFRDHLLWHLALMHLALGDEARASDLCGKVFEREPSSIAGDLHDSISLLWRLMLARRDLSARWTPFAALARERYLKIGLPYHQAHLAMALAAGGDWEHASKQLEALRGRVGKDRTGLLEAVLIPLIEGLHAFVREDYACTIERIEPLRERLVQLGGSRAQRDVYTDTLLEASFRAGDVGRAERLLADRVARRRDHFSLTANGRRAP
jgi:tetratricopeptide (TPR) repeat protein